MFLSKITFVVGAGASTECGPKAFPIGSGLRTIIETGYDYSPRAAHGRTSTGDQAIYSRLLRRYSSQTENMARRIAAARLIKDHLYMFPSIDAFIDHYGQHDDCVEEMGKAAIAANIARAERKSILAPDQDNVSYSFDIRRMRQTWLEPFARILMDNVKDPHAVGKEVSIICFNYDRCIEFYLIEALRRRYGVDYSEAHQIVGKMNIIHPYGTLGPLPDREGFHDERHPNFGPDVDDRFDPWHLIPNIKTYTERIEEGAALRSIRGAIAESQNLVFLGFGFTTENMKLLSSKSLADKPDRKLLMLTTGVGISSQVVSAVQEKVSNLFANPNGNAWPNSTVVEVGMGVSGKETPSGAADAEQGISDIRVL